MEQESYDPLATMSDVCGGKTCREKVLSSPTQCPAQVKLVTSQIVEDLYGLFHTFITVERTVELSTSVVHWLVGGMLPWVHCNSMVLQYKRYR